MTPRYGAVFHPAIWPTVKLMVISPDPDGAAYRGNALIVSCPPGTAWHQGGWLPGKTVNVTVSDDFTTAEGWEWDDEQP